MTPPPPPASRKRPERVAGGLLMALGAATMLGWLTRTPALFEIVHGLVPMVFNAGAAFFLCGVALCLSRTGRSADTARLAIGLAVATLMVITLVETAFDVDLRVNLASLQAWYDYGNTRPGRMAPNTALAFLLISVVLMMPDDVKRRRSAIAKVALTFAVLTIGLVGLIGYLTAPELLFGWARSARMAVHTATGVIIASVGLWVTWSQNDWYAGERLFRQGDKISFLSAGVLVVVTLTAGLTGFVILQRGFETSLEGRLAGIVKIRGPWLHALAEEVARSSANAAKAAGLPLRSLPSTPVKGLIDANEIARKLLEAGFRSVSFKDVDGNVLASFGRRSDLPAFDAPLDEIGDKALIWDQELWIRTRHQLGPWAGRMKFPADSVELVSGAHQLSTLLFDVNGLGSTAQVTACQRRGDTLICLPDSVNDSPFTVPVRQPTQQPLPMQLALAGTGPGIARTLDYRGHNVIAAYGTLAPGVGFVAKQDAQEAYAPIRAALVTGVPLIATLVLAGATAMFFQLNPLLRRMRRSEQDTAAAFAKNVAITNAVSDGVLTLDGDGCIESSNQAANLILGFAVGELEGLEFVALLPERERVLHASDLRSAFAGDDAQMLHLRELELLGLRSDGTEFPLELTLNAIPGSSERLFVAVIRDITSRRLSEEVLSRMAKFDALTGLPNRALFQDRLRTAIARAARSGRPLALLFLDLDGFKGINDRFGHAAGDELLKQVASRLTSEVRKTDTVARLGGDEFTIILEQLSEASDAEQVAEKAVSSIQVAFQVEEHQLHVTASVGMVLYDPRVEGSVEVSDLLKRADHSMYEVKRQGKNGFSIAGGVVSWAGQAPVVYRRRSPD